MKIWRPKSVDRVQTLQQLCDNLRQLAPMLKYLVGVLAVVLHSIANDQAAGVDFVTVRHGGKVNNALDVFKGILMSMSVEKLCVVISHTKTKKKRDSHTLEDNRWVAMGPTRRGHCSHHDFAPDKQSLDAEIVSSLCFR